MHEFRHFNVTVFEEQLPALFSRQSFRFEINFRSFELTNRLAQILHAELDHYLFLGYCRCHLGDNLTLAVDLDLDRKLVICGDEIRRLKELISKIKHA